MLDKHIRICYNKLVNKRADKLLKTEKREIMNTTIKNIKATINDDLLKSIVANDVERDALKDREKLLIAIYNEIAKAINDDAHVAILQCNYANKKSDTANLYNLIRYVDKDNIKNAITNIYVTIKDNKILLKLTVTAEKLFQDDLQKADYDIKKHCKQIELKNIQKELATLKAILKH